MEAKLSQEDAPARNGMQTATITRAGSGATVTASRIPAENSCLWKSNLLPFIFPGGPSALRRVPEQRRHSPHSPPSSLPSYRRMQLLPISPAYQTKVSSPFRLLAVRHSDPPSLHPSSFHRVLFLSCLEARHARLSRVGTDRPRKCKNREGKVYLCI